MKKVVLVIFFTILFQGLYSQKLKGIWEGVISSDPESSIIYYDLINEGKVLSITLDSGKIISLGESFVGFAVEKKDTLLIQEIDKNLGFFCIGNKINDSLIVCVYPSFSQDDSSYFYSGTDVFDYSKIDNLPTNILIQLYRVWGQKKPIEFLYYTNRRFSNRKKKSYVKSLINDEILIMVERCSIVEIISTSDKKVKAIVYLEKDGEWTGEIIEGWIKKEDVE